MAFFNWFRKNGFKQEDFDAATKLGLESPATWRMPLQAAWTLSPLGCCAVAGGPAGRAGIRVHCRHAVPEAGAACGSPLRWRSMWLASDAGCSTWLTLSAKCGACSMWLTHPTNFTGYERVVLRQRLLDWQRWADWCGAHAVVPARATANEVSG